MKKLPTTILKDENGQDFALTNLLGDYWVLHFYPKIGTSTSTMQAERFNELFEEFDERIVAISLDLPEVIALFKTKHRLKFKLLSDVKMELASQLGIVKNGRLSRSTFITDPWGRIRKEWFNVKASTHAKQVLEEFKKTIEEDLSINPSIFQRRAFRGLRSEPIEDEKLLRLIEAAHLAPSCANKQPWRFIVVRSREYLGKLHEALSGGNYWMKYAPAIVVVYTKDEFDCQLSENRNYALFDTGLAVGFLLIQATQMGLIAHPVAGYDPVKVKELFDIDGNVITLIAIGKWGKFDQLNEKHLEAEKSARNRQELSQIMKIV